MVDPRKFWTSKVEKLKKDNNFEDAVKVLDKVNRIKKDEKSKDYWYKQGVNYFEIREYENAEKAVKKSLEIGTQKYNSFFLMGRILYELKRYEESLEHYKKATEEYNKEHLRNTTKIHQMKSVRKFEEAVKYADKVYQEKELDEEFWYNKAMVLVKLNKFNEASKCLENSLEKNPDNMKILYELAKSEWLSGNMKNSLNTLERIFKINPSMKETLSEDKDFEQLFENKQFQGFSGSALWEN